MAYEFTPQLNPVPYKTTGELALSAKVTDFDSDIFDCGIVKFGWGEQPDLSDETMTGARAFFGTGGSVTNEVFTSSYDTWVDLDNEKISEYVFTVETTDGTTEYDLAVDFELDYINGKIKVLSAGNMADSTDYHISYDYNMGEKLISGLTSGTEYYYKGYLQPIILSSADMVNTLTSYPEASGDVFDNERIANVIMNNNDYRKNAIAQDNTGPGIWNSSVSSELYWKRSGVAFPSNVWGSVYVRFSDELPSEISGGKSLNFYSSGDFYFAEGYLEFEEDFTDVDTLKIFTKVAASYLDTVIKINGEELFSASSSHDWTERILDVATYTGNNIIQIGNSSGPSSTGSSSDQTHYVGLQLL